GSALTVRARARQAVAPARARGAPLQRSPCVAQPAELHRESDGDVGRSPGPDRTERVDSDADHRRVDERLAGEPQCEMGGALLTPGIITAEGTVEACRSNGTHE